MGQISYEQATNIAAQENNGFSVGFFTLRNDGDEAIVRFMHDSTASFDLVASHTISIDGKYRKVNCLRDPRDPMEKCPFCNSGIKVENRFYIRLIQYTVENGNIVPSAKIWERSLSYANKLATLINEYGPLSDCIFKIKRCGAAGSMDTTYEIMFASPQVYPPQAYPKAPQLFDDYKIIGGLVMDKSYEDMNVYLSTGAFPQADRSQANASVVNQVPLGTVAPVSNATIAYNPTPNLMSQPAVAPVQQPVPNPVQQPTPVAGVAPTGNAPWENPSPISRPVRTY